MAYDSKKSVIRMADLMPEQQGVLDLLGQRNFRVLLDVFQEYIRVRAELDGIEYSSDEYFRMYRREVKTRFPNILSTLKEISKDNPAFLSSFNFEQVDRCSMFDRLLHKKQKRRLDYSEETVYTEELAELLLL